MILSNWNNPRVSIIIHTIWIIIVFSIGVYYNIFAKDFFRLGPAKKGEKPVIFMGKEIKTYKGIILIIIYSFINQLITNYNSSVVNPWRINTIQDPKTTSISNFTLNEILVLLNIDNIFGWINYIINLATLLTMELQFIFPKIIASIIIDNTSIVNYLRDKTIIK